MCFMTWNKLQTHMWHLATQNWQYLIFYSSTHYFYPFTTGFTCPNDRWTGHSAAQTYATQPTWQHNKHEWNVVFRYFCNVQWYKIISVLAELILVYTYTPIFTSLLQRTAFHRLRLKEAGQVVKKVLQLLADPGPVRLTTSYLSLDCIDHDNWAVCFIKSLWLHVTQG